MPENPHETPQGKSAVAPIVVAVIGVPLVLLGSYVGAYLGMGEEALWGLSPAPDFKVISIDREFSHEWVATAFAPAAWLESKVRGLEVKAKTKQSVSSFP